MHYYPLGVLTISWAFWLWDTYLDYRQYRVFLKADKVPDELEGKIDDETFKKARAYSIDSSRFGFVARLFSQIQTTVTIVYFILPYLWDVSHQIMSATFGFSKSQSIEWEIFQSLTYVLITSIASTLINLPLSIYSTFVIEQRHGFNKQTPGFYAWDKLKKFIVGFLISAPIVSAIIYIVRRGGPYFFLYLWIFCFIVVCILTFFHGEIAAIFDKFTPLPAGELREKIEELSKSLNFPLANIFVVEGSKRSAHSNAYQSGIFNRKRIVIYDTLIESYYENIKGEKKSDESESASAAKDETEKAPKKGCNNEEILAVLCHELGHWYCGHLMKHLAFSEINFFLIFVIFSRFYKDPTFYAAFGFQDMPTVIGLLLLTLILTPYNELQGFIAIALGRRFEYQADEFAAKRGYSEELKSALLKLQVDNLKCPVYDELYSKFNHSHPTVIQRIKALSKKDQ